MTGTASLVSLSIITAMPTPQFGWQPHEQLAPVGRRPVHQVRPVADHVAEVIAGLERKPVVIGHSFGGLLAQIVAGRGLARRLGRASTRRPAVGCCRCRSAP